MFPAFWSGELCSSFVFKFLFISFLPTRSPSAETMNSANSQSTCMRAEYESLTAWHFLAMLHGLGHRLEHTIREDTTNISDDPARLTCWDQPLFASQQVTNDVLAARLQLLNGHHISGNLPFTIMASLTNLRHQTWSLKHFAGPFQCPFP